MAASAIPDTIADPADDDAFDSCFPAVEDTFQKIDSSFRILQQVCSAHVTLSRLFLRPLYSNTSLDRIAFAGAIHRDNDDASLRKNLYFLASELKNPTNVVIQLVQRGVLTLDEKDAIMRHENEHLKSLVTFVYLVKKHTSVFPKVLDALDVTQNQNIAKMLRDANANADSAPVPKIHTIAHPLEFQDPEQLQTQWECTNCTYLNSSLGAICEMCFKTKDFKDTPGNSSLVCPQCTFFNPAGCGVCQMCSFEIVPKASKAEAPKPEVLTPVPVVNAEWSDDDEW